MEDNQWLNEVRRLKAEKAEAARAKLGQAQALILDEYTRAVASNGAFHSAHEGFAVLYEEVDELWDEIKKRQDERSQEKLTKEAVQVAAMAMRFLVDVCLVEGIRA